MPETASVAAVLSGAAAPLPEPTRSQAEFVRQMSSEKPLISLSAPPGTGKTTILASAFLTRVAEGIPPSRILMCTHTNQARIAFEEQIRNACIPGVSELALPPKERIGRPLDASPPLWIGTIHDICRRILNCHATQGVSGNDLVVILGPELQARMRHALEDCAILPRGADDAARLVKKCISASSDIKRVGGDPSLAGKDDTLPLAGDLPYLKPGWAEPIALHETRMAEAGLVDPDGLLSRTWRLLKGQPAIRAAWSRRFDHVLIDEYQDTDAICTGIMGMVGRHSRIAVAGDPAQSIYGWRGAVASFDHLQVLEGTHGKPYAMSLKEDHRLTQSIQEAAAGIRSRMKESHPAPAPSGKEGDPPFHVQAIDDSRQTEAVAEDIRLMAEKKESSWSDCAVLVRTHQEKARIGKSLAAMKIPVWIAGANQDCNPGEVLMAWFAAVVRKDDSSLERALLSATPEISGISRRVVRAARTSAMAAKSTMWSHLGGVSWKNLESALAGVASDPQAQRQAKEEVEALQASVRRLAGFMEKAEEDREAEEATGVRVSPHTTLERISDELGLKRQADGMDKHEQAAYAQLMDLARVLSQRCADEERLLDLLERTSGGEREDPPPGHVQVRTMHTAKGMQWKHVFAPFWQEGVFPLGYADEEEERRLALVAMTRARETFRSYSSKTGEAGTQTLPSRHVREAGLEVIDRRPKA